MLVQRDADVTAVNCDGDLPLDLAADSRTESVLQTAMEEKDIQGQVLPLQLPGVCLEAFQPLPHPPTPSHTLAHPSFFSLPGRSR